MHLLSTVSLYPLLLDPQVESSKLASPSLSPSSFAKAKHLYGVAHESPGVQYTPAKTRTRECQVHLPELVRQLISASHEKLYFISTVKAVRVWSRHNVRQDLTLHSSRL
jgi:hypothetical protein